MDNNMDKQCKTCRHFVRTGIWAGGQSYEAGMCIAGATNEYTTMRVCACDLYQDKPCVYNERNVNLDSVILNALKKAAEDHTEETVMHMVWFCDYLRKEAEENRDV